MGQLKHHQKGMPTTETEGRHSNRKYCKKAGVSLQIIFKVFKQLELSWLSKQIIDLENVFVCTVDYLTPDIVVCNI